MPAYDVLLDTASQQVDVQLSTADAVASKAATIFSIASTIAAIVPALLPLGKTRLLLDTPLVWLLLLALGAYLATLVCFLLNYWSSNWKAGPNARELERICTSHDVAYAQRWASDAYLLSLELNEPRLRRKDIYFGLSVVTFVFEVGLLMGAAFVTFAR